MKKIITLLSLTLVALAIQAQTTYVIHVDDVSHVASFTKDGEELTFDADNNITINVSQDEEILCVLTTADPWVLSNDSYCEMWGVEYLYTGFRNVYEFYANGFSSDTNYYFVTVDNNEIRKNAATINIIGDPSKVSMWNYHDYIQYFTENVNTYRFMDEESKIVISPVDSSYYLYKVLHDGEEVERGGDDFEMTLVDGDVVDVYTNWPDKDITVTFELQGDACNKSFIEACIDYQTITDFSQPVVAKMGQIIDIDVAYINYTTDLFTVNGVEQEVGEWGAQYCYLLTEDLVIVLKQTKKECYTANVTVNDCSLIRYVEALVKDLKPTGNTFTVEVGKDLAWNFPVYFYPVDNATQIESCTVDGIPAEYDEDVSAFYVELTEDTKEIVINASQSVEVVFHVDDPSHVKSMIVADQAYQFDNEGNLTVYATEYCQWTISTVEPYVISAESAYSDYYSSGDVYTGTLYSEFASEYTNSIYVYDGCAYKTEYNIVTVDNDIARPYSAQINIFGDPKKVKMSEYGFYNEIYFTENENTFRFMMEPYSENNINISAVEYGTNLFKVLKGDEEQTPEYGSYSMTLADGDVVKVYTEWPDEEVTVSFELQGDACFKSFSEARINGQKITDFTQPYTAKMGQSINLYLSYYNYTTDLFTVNGVEQTVDEWGGSYTGVLTEDLHIVLKQTKKECNTATVKVDDYTRIKYSEAGIDLIPESNEFIIEIGKDMAQYNPISIYPYDYNCEITSCKVDGVDAEYNTWNRSYNINMEKDGQVVEVTTATLDRPYMFSFYFNSPEQEVQDKYNLYGWDLSCQFPREDLTADAIKPGYNFIDFSTELDGDFSFGTYGDVTNIKKYVYVYYENEKLEGAEGYGIVWPFTPADASSLKVFYTDVEPSFYTATFAVEDASVVKGAYVDGLKEITVSDKAEFTELQETGFTLLLKDGYLVKLDGEQIEPMEEPVLARSEEGTVYYFDLVKDLKVEILKGESGINTIAADDNAADPAVYNILGVKVSNGSTDNLPAGLYISKGQKFCVK